MIYIRIYKVGEQVSGELGCVFYKARAYDKSEVLQEWLGGSGGWIIATGALGTGVNIHGIVEVIHIDRPYGLTSFAQQSGCRGRDREISQSTIIAQVASGANTRATALQSDYTVEKINDDAMTDYIQSQGCRQMVLGRYLDGELGLSSCKDSVEEVVFCDYCQRQAQQEWILEELSNRSASQSASRPASQLADQPASQGASPSAGQLATLSANHLSDQSASQLTSPSASHSANPPASQATEASGSQVIAYRLQEQEDEDAVMFQVIRQLQRHCVFCTLIYRENRGSRIGEEPYTLENCKAAESRRYGMKLYNKWWNRIDLKGLKHCYKCGLPQSICRFIENGSLCEFPKVIFPGLFILRQSENLETITHSVGFQGEYKGEL